MSDDNLESLDNASLRKKCLEFGLPNVPITDTSRKLLIRKLRAAINGDTDDKKKNRRETIHVTKIPSLVEANATTNSNAEETVPKRPPSRVNRRTIAVTSATSTTTDDSALASSAETNKAQTVTERRRSVRPQAEIDVPPPVIPVSQKRKNAVLAELENEDEDEDDVILLEAAEASEKDIVIPRARRSVSLSKTGVVTTSYSQETSSTIDPPPTVHETESESEYENTSKKFSSNVFDPVFAKRPLAQSIRRDIPTSYGFSEPSLSSFGTSIINQSSDESGQIYNKPSLQSTASSRYSTLGSGYPSLSSSSSIVNTSTTTTRRYTSGAASIPTLTKYSNMFDDHSENDENKPETPYLSDFARKLERLKAEPLVKGVDTTPRNIPIKRETQRFHHTSSIASRRNTMQSDSVSESFKNFLFALDRKYKLKRNFSILFVLILILFIYIVFIN